MHALSLANADRIISVTFYCIEFKVLDKPAVLSTLICWTGGEQQLEMSWGTCFTPLAANNFHYPCSRVTTDEHFGWLFRYTQYWPNFASAGSFITYSNRSGVGPLLHASANSRLWRECESTAESPEVPGWLLRDLINLPQFHPNLVQFFVHLPMCELQISACYTKCSHWWKLSVCHWQL